jgi:hypothetical protein
MKMLHLGFVVGKVTVFPVFPSTFYVVPGTKKTEKGRKL